MKPLLTELSLYNNNNSMKPLLTELSLYNNHLYTKYEIWPIVLFLYISPLSSRNTSILDILSVSEGVWLRRVSL